jgi:hypothetical protein
VSFITDTMLARAKAEARILVQGNARFALERMSQDIREAKGINAGASVFGSNPGALSLQMPDASKDPTVFDLSGGLLRVKVGAGSATALTSSKVSVSNLVFTDLSTSKTKNIKMSITLDTGGAALTQAFKATQTLDTSVTLRGK